MLIEVYGGNTSHRALIRDAVNFAGRKLMSERLCDSLEITIKFQDMILETGSIAECEWLDSNYRAKMFEITLDKNQTTFLQVLSIMHEMVHVKQFARGELVQSMKDAKSHKWMKSTWVDDTKTSYYDLPWEIEAHGREKGMMLAWLEQTTLLSNSKKQEWRDKFLF